MNSPRFADVESAAHQIAGVAHKTPVATSRSVNDRVGAELFFKCENLQRAGAFKFRGAYNALSRLGAEERRRGVVAFSSGNHAQAIYILEGKVRHEFGPGLKQTLENEAGDFIYIKPDVPHEVFNMSNTEPVVAFVARSSAEEWDNIVPYDRGKES